MTLPVTLPVTTDRPTSTGQLGSVATVVPSGTADAVLADGSDATYVEVGALAQTAAERVRVGFTTPVLPAGARVLSVGLRRREQTVTVSTTTTQPPICLHWHHCLIAPLLGAAAGALSIPRRIPFQTQCTTTTTTTTAWVDKDLGASQTAPDGSGWDLGTNLATYSYEFGRGDSGPGAIRVSGVWRDITYQRQSTVTITGPTGTISAARTTILWAHASPDSQPQEAFRVAVYAHATTLAAGFAPFDTAPLQGSGWVLGDDQQWTLTDDLTDGQYDVFVQARTRWAGPQPDFLTDVASQTFTRTASTGAPTSYPPPASLVSAVFDPTTNSVAITAQPSSSSPATVAYTIQRSDDGGLSYTGAGQPGQPSLTMVPANGTTPVTVLDRFAPIGRTAIYRVLSYATVSPNAAATFSGTASVLVTSATWWMKHPTDPLLDTPVLPAFEDGHKITRPRVMGTFATISRNGRVNKRVVYGPSYGEEGELKLLFNAGEDSEAWWANFDQLDRSNLTVFLQQADGTQFWAHLGPGSSGQDTKVEYTPMPGNAAKRLQSRAMLSYTEADPPTWY